jgi:hypothetical protein
MSTMGGSLRAIVEKWFMAAPVSSIRTCRLPGKVRCVRVQALRPDDPIELLFFRHDDGMWRVFPPATESIAMRANGDKQVMRRDEPDVQFRVR